jgi:hypothetical protein
MSVSKYIVSNGRFMGERIGKDLGGSGYGLIEV